LARPNDAQDNQPHTDLHFLDQLALGLVIAVVRSLARAKLKEGTMQISTCGKEGKLSVASSTNEMTETLSENIFFDKSATPRFYKNTETMKRRL
jgi:hypothetical protein